MTYDRCIICKCLFSDVNVFSQAGWKETYISGACEICFDKLFKDLKEEDEANHE